MSIRTETTDCLVTKQTRSKLEHYGFNKLPRPTSFRSNNKRQTLIKENQNKKIRPNELSPNQ